MDKTIAFLELKYGHIYGGNQWQKVVNDAAVLLYTPENDRLRIFTKSFKGNIQIVLSNGITDDLGITTGRRFEVLDLESGKKRSYDEKFYLKKPILNNKQKEALKVKAQLKQFMVGVLKYHEIENLVTFGGSRDLTLCEQAGVKFGKVPNIEDTQRLLQKQTKHLFSLNMISKIVNFKYQNGWVTSNSCQYRLHERTQENMKWNSATYDVVRQFIAHMEFTKHQDNTIIKAALQMQKVQDVLDQREKEAAEKRAEEEAKRAEAEAQNPPTTEAVEDSTAPTTDASEA